MGQVGFRGPLLAILGPFVTPLGPSVGHNLHILSFWRYQNLLEPLEKYSEDPRNVISCENAFLRKTRFFDPKIGLFTYKMGQNEVQWEANFGVLRVPDHLGTEIISLGAKNFFSKKRVFFGRF